MKLCDIRVSIKFIKEVQVPPTYNTMPISVRNEKPCLLCCRWIMLKISNDSYLTNKAMYGTENTRNVFFRLVSVLFNMSLNCADLSKRTKPQFHTHANVRNWKPWLLCCRWMKMALCCRWEVPVTLVQKHTLGTCKTCNSY